MGPCPEYILDTCPSALVLSCPQSLPSHHCQRPFSPADKSLVAPEAGYKVMSRSPSLELEVLQSAQAYFLSTSSLLWATSWAGCPSQPPYGHISRHLLGLLLSRDAVPAISICEPFHAWRLSSAVTSLRPLPPHPPQVTTHFTEMENSPGELSLSRIRKAPRWFRFIRISSASCREILPKYHLQRDGAGEGSRESRLPTPPCPGAQHC